MLIMVSALVYNLTDCKVMLRRLNIFDIREALEHETVFLV